MRTRLAVVLAVSVFAVPAFAESEPAPTPTPIRTPLSEADAVRQVRIELRDGQSVQGTLAHESLDAYDLVLDGGARMTVPKSAVRAIVFDPEAPRTSAAEVWFSDPNRTRYFYGPSAFMLRKGQAYFSQKEFLFSAVGYGVTENFSVLAGAVLPLWVSGPAGMNAIVGLKAGAPISDSLRIAGGLETLVLPNVFSSTGYSPIVGSLLFGSVTYGVPDRNFTVSVGKPLLYTGRLGDIQSLDLIATVSGMYRLHPNMGLMTENWLVMPQINTGNFVGAHAFGARFMVESIAGDVGLIWLGASENSAYLPWMVPIPWVDFTWNFALGKV